MREGSKADARRARELTRAVGATLVAGVVYSAMVWLTTQVQAVREVSQWQADPPDAFASIGVQIVVVVGALTLVRWIRARWPRPGTALEALRTRGQDVMHLRDRRVGCRSPSSSVC